MLENFIYLVPLVHLICAPPQFCGGFRIGVSDRRHALPATVLFGIAFNTILLCSATVCTLANEA
jgi:hypothetical protein